VDLATCSTAELLQLRQCCQEIVDNISDRLLETSCQDSVEESPRSACTSGDKRRGRVFPSALLTTSCLAAHRDEVGESTNAPGDVGRVLTAQQLDSDLGLWQAVPQELFPGKRSTKPRADTSSREGSERPVSPSMLSVATAPSDGGTIRFGRITDPPAATTAAGRVSRVLVECASAQSSQCLFDPCGPPNTARREHDTGASDRASPQVGVSGAERSFEQPVFARTARSELTSAVRTAIPFGSGVAPIPECNSSLETPDSMGLTQTSSRMLKGSHSVHPCSSAMESFKELPSEQMAIPARAAQDSTGSISSFDKHTECSHRGRGSASSSVRSHKQRKSATDAALMVQYGFQSPGMSFLHSSPTHRSLCGTELSADGSHQQPGSARFALATAGPVKCGLLSASLSQCASNCTSPHASPAMAVHALGIPSKLSFLKAAQGESSSPPHQRCSLSGDSPQRGSMFGCSPRIDKCEPCKAPTCDGSARSSSPVSSIIPEVLQAQMVTMGFHRPSRVASRSDLYTNRAGDSQD
jgi:hypothetical protein